MEKAKSINKGFSCSSKAQQEVFHTEIQGRGRIITHFIEFHFIEKFFFLE